MDQMRRCDDSMVIYAFQGLGGMRLPKLSAHPDLPLPDILPTPHRGAGSIRAEKTRKLKTYRPKNQESKNAKMMFQIILHRQRGD